MANPYLSNFTRAVPDLREVPRPTMFGQVSASPARRPAQRIGEAASMGDEWISQYGPTACDVFSKMGKSFGVDPTYSDVTDAKDKFDRAFDAYEKPPGSEVKDFAWDCFVQGFDEGQSARTSRRQDLDRGGKFVAAADDGWGFGTWALVLTGVGAAGLFGYNYMYAK